MILTVSWNVHLKAPRLLKMLDSKYVKLLIIIAEDAANVGRGYLIRKKTTALMVFLMDAILMVVGGAICVSTKAIRSHSSSTVGQGTKQ